MAPFVAEMLEGAGPAVLAHPHIDEIQERFRERGVDGITDMPADWWIELGAIGTFDDVVHHAEALIDAGADDVAFFPGPSVDLACAPSGAARMDRSTTGRMSGVSLRLDLFTSPVSPCGVAGDAAFRTRHRFPGLEPVAPLHADPVARALGPGARNRPR